MAGVHDRAVDHHVVVDELGRPGAVGHDPADRAGHQEHVLGPVGLEPVRDLCLVAQVELLAPCREDVGEALGLEPTNHGGAHQAGMAGDVDSSLLAAAQLDVHVVAGHGSELVGKRIDDRRFADVGLGPLGAAPVHRLAVVAPVAALPPANRGDLGAVGLHFPVDLDRQLPAHRGLPRDRRFARLQRGEMQRASRPTGEPGSVEEDAGAVDDLGVGAFGIVEHVIGVDCRMVLKDAGIECRRQRRDGHRFLRVGQFRADRTATLVEMLGGLVEDPLATASPDACPVGCQEASIEAPRDVAIDDLFELAHASIRSRLSKSSWLRYAPHIVRLPV